VGSERRRSPESPQRARCADKGHSGRWSALFGAATCPTVVSWFPPGPDALAHRALRRLDSPRDLVYDTRRRLGPAVGHSCGWVPVDARAEATDACWQGCRRPSYRRGRRRSRRLRSARNRVTAGERGVQRNLHSGRGCSGSVLFVPSRSGTKSWSGRSASPCRPISASRRLARANRVAMPA
jgi:hypothetical protein